MLKQMKENYFLLSYRSISRGITSIKLFNKNNVKISYSCMPNMKSVIQNYNANLLSNHTTPVVARSCSCNQKSECLLNNECLSESLVYKTAVSQTPSQINIYYYGACEKTFKRTVQQSSCYI